MQAAYPSWGGASRSIFFLPCPPFSPYFPISEIKIGKGKRSEHQREETKHPKCWISSNQFPPETLIRKGLKSPPSSPLLPAVQSAFGYMVEIVIIPLEEHLTAISILKCLSLLAIWYGLIHLIKNKSRGLVRKISSHRSPRRLETPIWEEKCD